MCGITLVWHQDRPRAESACRYATEAQQHRGPDAEGFYSISTSCGSLALGHRRLAILDLSEAGAQPMLDSKTRNVIVFNGEIYNFRELRSELEAKGVNFRSNSDTEVLLLGYREWGAKVFERAKGMFAIALWDEKQQCLFLARDHAGMKPLYWSLGTNQLVVASELQAVINSGLVKKNIDRSALAGLLAYGSIPEPKTMIEGVSMFPPASWAKIDFRGLPRLVEQVEYWSLPTQINVDSHTNFRNLLDSSVRGHLESDVPVGIFLSGGIDSTAITAAAARQNTGSLKTLTVGFADNASINETDIAQETATQLGTEHSVVTLSNVDALEQTRSWMKSIDQPCLDGFNTYLVSGAARECGLKVVLSGLGGDEIFGGYSVFRTLPRLHNWTRHAGIIPQSIRRWVANQAFVTSNRTARYKAADMAADLGNLSSLALGRRRLFSDTEIRKFDLKPESLELTPQYLLPEHKLPEIINSNDFPAAIAAMEVSFYMRNTLLRDSDVSGMSHSLEIRLPLLDRDLMTAALQLPAHKRMSQDTVNKPRLVEAGGACVSRVASHSKRGFSLPYHDWLHGPLKEHAQESIHFVAKSGLLDPHQLQNTLDSFYNCRSGTPPWSRIWTLAVLGQWLHRLNSPL